MPRKLIKSPFNYTGNKFKLLPQIMPLMPDNITHFVDLFCGGCAVGMNVTAENVTFNDKVATIPGLLQYFLHAESGEKVLQDVDACIEHYNITVDNIDGYEKLRTAYNARCFEMPVVLLTLILHAFNSIIRYNSQGDYNAPFGYKNSWLNPSRRKVLATFVDELVARQVELANSPFNYVELPDAKGAYIYCDPPYIITQAVYNADWTMTDEYALYRYLDDLNDRGYLWGLSNVTHHNGKVNIVLNDWLQRYHVHEIEADYNKSLATKSDTAKKWTSREVFITNY